MAQKLTRLDNSLSVDATKVEAVYIDIVRTVGTLDSAAVQIQIGSKPVTLRTCNENTAREIAVAAVELLIRAGADLIWIEDRVAISAAAVKYVGVEDGLAVVATSDQKNRFYVAPADGELPITTAARLSEVFDMRRKG